MLMALLPLAGWAQTATLGEVAVGTYTYGTATLPVPVVKDSEGAILTESTHYTVSTSAYKEAACTTVVNKEDMKGDVNYYLKITGAGAYLGQEKSVYFTCQKKDLTVAVSTTFQRDYLATTEPPINASSEITLTGLVTVSPWSDSADDLGTLTYTYDGYGNSEYPGGEYDITFSGYESDVYNIIYPTKKFTIKGTDISSATVTVKDGTAFADKTYKGAAYAPADLTGLVLVYGTKELVQGTDFTIAVVTSSNTGEDWKTVGTNHAYTVNFKGNYSGSKTSFGTFNIVQAPLSVDVDDIEKTYSGEAVTTITGATLNYYGFVGEDVATKSTLISAFTAPTVQVADEDGALNVGTYDLEISGGSVPSGSNYKFVNYLNTGKLKINPFELKLKASDASKGPGAADPKFTLTAYTMAATNETLSGVTFNRAEGEEVGSSYDITPVWTSAKVTKTVGSVKTDVTSNYEFSAATPKGKLTINKAALTITIKDQTKVYGDADPETIASPVEGTNYVVTGLVDGDEITSLTLTKSWTDASDAGNYILTGEAVYTGTDHYTGLTVVPGNFEITKAPLTVTLPIKNVAAGGTIAATAAPSKDGIEITGWKKDETAAQQLASYDLSLNNGSTARYSTSLEVDGSSNLTNQTKADGYILTLTTATAKNYQIVVDATTTPVTYDSYIAGKLIVGTGSTDAVDIAGKADIQTYDKETRPVKFASTVTKKLSAGRWNTLVLPFETTVTKLSAALGYAVVDMIDQDNADEGKVSLKLAFGTIPANTPFLVQPGTDVNLKDINYFSTSGNEVTIKYDAEPKAEDKGKHALVGTYEGLTITDADTQYYYSPSEKKFLSANNNAIGVFGAYLLDNSGSSSAPMIYIQEIDGSVTAIDVVSGTTQKIDAEGSWYTINGVKLDAAPTQKGIYIKNGKKFVIK